MDRILMHDAPDIAAQVLEARELDTCPILGKDLDHRAQQGRLLALEGRGILFHIARAAQLISDNQSMGKGRRRWRIEPDLSQNRFLDLYATWDIEEDPAAPKGR